MGDARAVLCRKGTFLSAALPNLGLQELSLCTDCSQSERLTHDHKGADEDEVKRIQAAGGFVVMVRWWQALPPLPTLTSPVQGRVNGILAVTRSLGDRAMKQYVVGDPYCRTVELQEDDSYLILACDGVRTCLCCSSRRLC